MKGVVKLFKVKKAISQIGFLEYQISEKQSFYPIAGSMESKLC